MIATITTSVASADAATQKPPVARKIPKEIVTNGDKRVDNYFWLREKTNAEVIAYLEAENHYADGVTRPLQKFRDDLYREFLSHLKETDTSAPVRRGDIFIIRAPNREKTTRSIVGNAEPSTRPKRSFST